MGSHENVPRTVCMCKRRLPDQRSDKPDLGRTSSHFRVEMQRRCKQSLCHHALIMHDSSSGSALSCGGVADTCQECSARATGSVQTIRRGLVYRDLEYARLLKL